MKKVLPLSWYPVAWFLAIAPVALLNLIGLSLLLLPNTAIAQTSIPRIQQRDGDFYFELGLNQYNAGQLEASALSFEAALGLYRQSANLAQQASVLHNLVVVYSDLNRSEDVIAIVEDALDINEKHGDQVSYLNILNYGAWAFSHTGQYERALRAFEQGLAIANASQQSHFLVGLCHVHDQVGEAAIAIDFGQQALALAEAQGDSITQLTSLTCIGIAYIAMPDHEQAVDFLHQALTLAERMNSVHGQYLALLNLGWAYQSVDQYESAVTFFEQALPFAQQSDAEAEAWVIGNLGHSYGFIGRYEEGLDLLFQALPIAEGISNRYGQWSALRSIAIILERQNQPELAIIFYKQSINIIEELRGNISSLSRTTQQSYAESVSGIYRRLANLLIQQDRILEAQQVLDLLQVEELNEYLNDVRGNERTAEGVSFWQAEEEILAQFNAQQNNAIALGRELRELQQIPAADRTERQQARITELVTLEIELNQQFNEFLDSDEVSDLINQLVVTTDRQAFDPMALQSLRDELHELDAVLFYPLILDDRLELIITTPNSPPLRRTVDVSRQEINETILEFRQALEDPTRDAISPAHQLYQWLLEPLETDLATVESRTIIYAPDGQLRYIPLSALHDGEQWVAERYAVNNITAQSLTDWNRPPTEAPRVLAGAFANERVSYSVNVGDRMVEMRGLPFAGEEVASLASAMPNTTSFVDEAFNLSAVQSQLNEYDIIHFATHAAFVPESSEESFILFGNGDRSTLAEVRNWSLQNVDLVVLSACETGLGGFGNGAEILGLGYQFQRAGARAAIASLWQVSDGGTQVLMDAFYAALNNGYSKAEALQRAQQALITSDETVLEGDRGNATIEIIDTRTGQPLERSTDLAHPYYWAPFILIGNGL